MDLVEQSIIIIALALMSYWVFTKLHLPAPAIMAPMLSIGVLQIMGAGFAELPMNMINSFQIIIGMSVGAKINKRNLGNIKDIWRASLVIALYTMASTAIMTFLIRNFTDDFATALFSAAPGGITEMTVLALAYDSEIVLVSTFQFVRLIVILSVIPIIAKFVKDRQISSDKENSLEVKAKQVHSSRRILSYVMGISGGIVLLAIGFPGGGVVGATLATGFANVVLKEEYIFPSKVMRVALLGVGVTIGLEFSPALLQKVQEMIIPVVGFSIVIVLGNLVVGRFIQYITKWDTITCMLGSAPGGQSQMLVVGEEMKADVLKISIMQLVRILTIILCIPVIAALLA